MALCGWSAVSDFPDEFYRVVVPLFRPSRAHVWLKVPTLELDNEMLVNAKVVKSVGPLDPTGALFKMTTPK